MINTKSFFKTFLLALGLMLSTGMWAIDWTTIGWVGNSNSKFKVAAEDDANLPNVVNVQKPGWSAETGIYMTFPAAGITCSHACAVDGAGICLYISQFEKQETEVTVTYAGGSKTFYVYNADGDIDCDKSGMPQSEYDYTAFGSGNTACRFSWETLCNGNIKVTLYEPDGTVVAGTHFRGAGVKLAQMTVGSEAGSEYFTTNVNTSSNIQTFVLKDGKSIPQGTTISVANAVVEYAVAKEGNAWPSYAFTYTYGSVCAGNYPLTALALEETAVNLEMGKTLKLTPVFTPVYTSEKDLVWETSDASKAIVVNGVVTPVAAGEVTITARSAAHNTIYASCVVTVIERLSQCYGDLGHFGGAPKVHYEIVYADGNVNFELTSATGHALDFAEIQIIGVGNYGMTADGNGGYTFSHAGTLNDKWYFRFLYSDDTFGGNEMTAQNFDTNDANMRYYVVGECPAPYEAVNEDYTKLPGVTAFSETTRNEGEHPASAGIDNDLNSYWESIWDINNQYYTIDLGKECVFNTVVVRFGGHRAGKFDVEVSRDGENFSKFAEDVDGINNDDASCGGNQVIGRYVRLLLKNRPNGYGFDVKNVQIKYVSNSELTTLTASISDKYLIAGQTYNINIDARDQYGLSMDAGEVEYQVLPAAMGSVVDGRLVLNNDVRGEVTVKARVNTIESADIVKRVVTENIARGQAVVLTAEEGTRGDVNVLVDGNKGGSTWDFSNTNDNPWKVSDDPETYDRNYASWVLVDLGGVYEIDMVNVYFSGACSHGYGVWFSYDGVNYTEAYRYRRNCGENHQHTDLLYSGVSAAGVTDLGVDADAVRYVKLINTEMGNYGARMYELEIYGAESHSVVDDVAPVMTSATLFSKTTTQAVLAVAASDLDGSGEPTTIEKYMVSVNGADPVQMRSTDGKITLTGLTMGTAYEVVVKAKDDANNVSESGITVNFTTDFDSSINLALNKPVLAGYGANPGISNNGNKDDRWGTGGNPTHPDNDWWQVDLGNAYVLNNIKIYWEGAYATNYDLLGSFDGSEWFSLGHFATAPSVVSQAEAQVYPMAGQAARYVKIYANSLRNNGWGMSFWEFEVYASDVLATDDEKPVMVSASLVSVTDNSAVIAVEATDNSAVKDFHVIDALNGIDQYAVATDGNITITELAGGTAYNFTITVRDLSLNVSDNNKVVAATTTAHYTFPQETAPVPTHAQKDVRAVYSDQYTINPVWNSYRAEWGGSTMKEDVDLADDHMLKYTNLDYVGWTCAGALDARDMQVLHIDIWAENDGRLGIVPIYGGAGLTTDDNKRKIVSLVGQQWNSFDLDLAVDFAGLDLSSIFQFKYDNAVGTIFYIDNVYFWREPLSYALTTEDTDFYTFYANEEVSIPAGMKAFTGVFENGALVLNELTEVIPARTGVLVKTEVAGTYTFEGSTTNAAAVAENSLRGVAENTARTDIETAEATRLGAAVEVFVVGKKNGVVGFYKSTKETISAHRAYVPVTEAMKPAAGAPIRIVMHEDTATGMEDIATGENVVKFIENGTIYIMRNAHVYDMMGRLVK